MIIEFSESKNLTPEFHAGYPDQFLKEKDKLEDKGWIKSTCDYFYNVAHMQYRHQKDKITKNYNLVKGVLSPEDFYEEASPELKSFVDVLSENVELPSYVQNYSIMGSPLNTMLGEQIKRPDGHKFKAYDEDSKNEELQFKTNLLQEYIKQKITDEVKTSMMQESEQGEGEGQGQEPKEEDVQAMTLDRMKEYMMDYTSQAEKWANKTLEVCKVEFNMKEKSEEIFRDQCIVAKEYMHVYEDNSKTGFNVETVNPKNMWRLTTPDRKYTKDAYAAGIITVMEISEIIEKVTDLTTDEIKHLRKTSQTLNTLIGRSNYPHNAKTGIDSINYDTYNRAVLQERQLLDADLQLEGDNKRDIMSELFGRNVSLSQYGEKFVVVQGYFKSKKQIKRVDYVDENNQPQTVLTDENYIDGSIPTELSVEEGWTTQWYKFIKIGSDIYKISPFKLLDYCPIIGVDVEIRNTQARSLVDMMKPFQTLYNICMNQLFQLLRKEKGVVFYTSLRRIPTPKDGDDQDALDIWEKEAEEKGIIFEDDSPENMKSPGNNTNNARAIDLSRTQEIQSRYQLAAQLKIECWDLIGISRQRQGNIQATETATATNTAITQSYAQTEPIYAQHEYVMDQVYQAIVDAAQYIESNKPSSTLSYINNVGESVFLEMNTDELKMRDLKIFSTSRPQDQQVFNELRQLSQPMLQNGASPYDIITLYTTNSVREMKNVFKTLKDQQDQFRQAEQQQQQQQIEQQQQQHQADLQLADQHHQEDVETSNYNKEEDRLNKLEVATIMASSKTGGVPADNNNNGIADALEVSRLYNDENSVRKSHELKLAELTQKDRHFNQQMQTERDRIVEEKRRTKSEHEIALKKIAVEKKKIMSKPKPSSKKK